MIHPTAEVSPQAEIGEGTKVWHQAQIREGARLGRNCIVGKGVYVDFGVQIGDNVKIQNGASVYQGATVEDGVFIGPGAILTNDKMPRAITPEGVLKTDEDWEVSPIRVGMGASIGTGVVVLPGVVVGRWAMIGSGAVVTRDVPDHGLAVGVPARLVGFACSCGRQLRSEEPLAEGVRMRCPHCHRELLVSRKEWEKIK